jgi:hypothetical protein
LGGGFSFTIVEGEKQNPLGDLDEQARRGFSSFVHPDEGGNPLYHNLLTDRKLYEALVLFDEDLAALARAAGCPCGGRLHAAHYPRKPRGGPADLGPEYDRRWSFCCDRHGCRQRVTPASVRFLGRRVYLGVTVVLVTIMAHGLTAGRLSRLRSELGGSLSVRTIERWRHWWRALFPASPFWKKARGRFVPAVEIPRLPASLLERFLDETLGDRLHALLGFLSPITTRSLLGASSSMGG